MPRRGYERWCEKLPKRGEAVSRGGGNRGRQLHRKSIAVKCGNRRKGRECAQVAVASCGDHSHDGVGVYTAAIGALESGGNERAARAHKARKQLRVEVDCGLINGPNAFAGDLLRFRYHNQPRVGVSPSEGRKKLGHRAAPAVARRSVAGAANALTIPLSSEAQALFGEPRNVGVLPKATRERDLGAQHRNFPKIAPGGGAHAHRHIGKRGRDDTIL